MLCGFISYGSARGYSKSLFHLLQHTEREGEKLLMYKRKKYEQMCSTVLAITEK